jgi:hypothetical protein
MHPLASKRPRDLGAKRQPCDVALDVVREVIRACIIEPPIDDTAERPTVAARREPRRLARWMIEPAPVDDVLAR